MSYERRTVRTPERPVLVVALEGWIDPGFASQHAIGAVLEQVPAKTYAAFAGEDLIDHRARRPRTRVRNGVRGRVLFSAPRLRVGRDLIGHGIAALIGPEPDYRWRDFSAEVTGLALELEVPLVVGLGAFPAAVPHTKPVAVLATASNADLARRVGYRRGTIEVPAGIGDVIGAACSEAGIPSVGLWARVPHYVGAAPYLPASLALLDQLCTLADLTLDLSELRTDAALALQRIDELIAESEEHQEMVRQLEEQYDEELDEGEAVIAPASEEGFSAAGEHSLSDELIAELERFLRGETDR